MGAWKERSVQGKQHTPEGTRVRGKRTELDERDVCVTRERTKEEKKKAFRVQFRSRD